MRVSNSVLVKFFSALHISVSAVTYSLLTIFLSYSRLVGLVYGGLLVRGCAILET